MQVLEIFVPQLFPSGAFARHRILLKPVDLQGFLLIGETGFEPATARPPAGCATRLRHSPRFPRFYGQADHAAVRSLWEHTFVIDAAPDSARTCGCCQQLLPISDFAWRRKTCEQRDSYCRACRAAYKQEHYATNRERYIADAVRRKQAIIAERTAYLIEFFRERPCIDCGETDPLVLEFDHLGHKNFNISKGLRNNNWQAVLDEIATCDVVCANCHRRRTALRGGFARAGVAQW
jgi:hypothetical protein